MVGRKIWLYPAYEFAPFEAIVFIIDFLQRYDFKVDFKPPYACDRLGTLRHRAPVTTLSKKNTSVSPSAKP